MQIGKRVTWTSSGTAKAGIVTHIVPAGSFPAEMGVPRLVNSGLPRDHETYIVRGQHIDLRTGKPTGRKENYWPRVSLLTFHHDEPKPDIERLLLGLQTIADFPITDPLHNMDAANMRKIAVEALDPASGRDGRGRGAS